MSEISGKILSYRNLCKNLLSALFVVSVIFIIIDFNTSRFINISGRNKRITCAIMSPDGKKIVIIGDGCINIIEVNSFKNILRMEGLKGKIWSASFSSDSGKIVSTGMRGPARVWNAMSGKQTGVYGDSNSWVSSASFTHDGKRIVTGEWDGTVRIWDTLSGERLTFVGKCRDIVKSIICFPDNMRIIRHCSPEITAQASKLSRK